MAFRFYIDSQLVDQPINDKQLLTSIKRDQQTGGINVTQDATLEWANNNNLDTGVTSAYQYLKNLLDTSICSEARVEIRDEVENDTNRVYTGVIKITQIEVDEQRFILKIKVQDNSFYAYINNNQQIPVNLGGTQTKSKEILAPIDLYSVDLFNSNGCAYGSSIGALYHGYLFQDVFSLIIRAITDNGVAFQSDFLDSLTNQLFLFKGQDLLNPYTIFPLAPVPTYEVTFSDMFAETDKLRNVGYYIDMTDPDAPVFRLEDSATMYGQTVLITLPGVKHLRTYVDTSRLYSCVLVGSEGSVDGTAPWLTWEDATSIYGWKQEKFFPQGQCNTNNELNLVNSFQINSNVIQDTTIGQSTSFIDDYFIIQCENVDAGALTSDATQFQYFGAGGCYYNLGLNNYRKMQQHADKFETTFGSFLSMGSDGFKALLGDTSADDLIYTSNSFDPNFIPNNGIFTNFVAEYPNETTSGGYDGNNNYNNITFEYVIPADGSYSFTHRMKFDISGFGNPNWIPLGSLRVRNNVALYDSGMSLIDSTSTQASYDNNGFYVIDTTYSLNGTTGDIVQASYDISFPQMGFNRGYQYLNLRHSSFFECNGTPDGQSTVTSSADNLRKLRYEFEYYIPESDWRTILATPIGQIGFEKDGITRYGWIDEMQHDNQTGRTLIKLITNNAITT